jgi:iron complex transport system substrate-binding protein
MIFAIGAGKDVIGVSSFDTYPADVRSLPKVGALLDPDFERILSLKPDLVVVYGSQTDLIARLTRAGVPMFRYEHAGLADVTGTIRALGDRLERTKEGRALADRIDREIDAVRKRVRDKRRPRTIVVFGREPGALRNIYASAGVGFLHDMLEAAGGDDVFTDVKRQNIQATVEILLARAPEVIIEIQPESGWSAARATEERAVWRSLSALPAVRSDRIYVIADDRLMVPGPRVAEAVRVLAETLHGK